MLWTDRDRLAAAFEKARLELLQRRTAGGYWVGELATSALATATAVSALALVKRRLPSPESAVAGIHGEICGRRLDELILGGIGWLADHQNSDGGWGDTDQSHSNVATTFLALAAFHLTGVPADHADLITRADRYLDEAGRLDGLRRRYGRDKTFAVPILANAALARLVSWKHVSALPFELACLPQRWYRFLRLPVVSYAIPALVAIGQARFYHRPPWNPFARAIRSLARERSLEVLARMQPTSGGYLEAIPLTSFVVMSLASIGRVDHAVTRRGVDFLVHSVRPDGSWPIDTNLATWNTTLALNALSGAGEEIAELADLNWLLACQHRMRHPFTGADPGGWGWSDLSGAVPDADDTPGALLALASWRQQATQPETVTRIEEAATEGLRWLLALQNADGGWPTFCRGWGKLPFDRSGADLTAHALRALRAWRDRGLVAMPVLERAERDGLAYLERSQRDDGSWIPLWFGNQDHPREENPVYGTARVLLAYRDLNQSETPAARRGFKWLVEAQLADGGWSGGFSPSARAAAAHLTSGVEETALAVEALAAASATPSGAVQSRDGSPDAGAVDAALGAGVRWLIESVETGRFRETSPIGFYFAKLWYYESLYPIIFTVAGLGRVLRETRSPAHDQPASTSIPC